LKKSTGSVQFGFSFISLKPKKPNRTQTEKKLSQTGKKPSQNRFEPDFFLKNQTETNWIEIGRFEPISVRFRFFFKKNWFGYFFLIKNKPKMIIHNICYYKKTWHLIFKQNYLSDLITCKFSKINPKSSIIIIHLKEFSF
jgi:hypothetical protein